MLVYSTKETENIIGIAIQKHMLLRILVLVSVDKKHILGDVYTFLKALIMLFYHNVLF